MKIHELKIDSEFFDLIISGIKKFEIRYNDRHFKINDIIILNEINLNGEPSGRKLKARISYMTDYEQKEKYVVLGIEDIKIISNMTK